MTRTTLSEQLPEPTVYARWCDRCRMLHSYTSPADEAQAKREGHG
jgi:hypothetical protein